MIRPIHAAAMAGVLLWTPAAMARTANYTQSDAQFRDDAAALEVMDFPAMPERSDVHVVIEDEFRLDNDLRILGLACKAWEVVNPLSQMVKRVFEAWDGDGQLTATTQRPLVRLRIDSSLATMRCVEVEELKSRCLARTAITGQATIEETGKAPRIEPIAVEVEQNQTAGTCYVARGTGLSGRSASIALVDRLRQIAAPE